MSARAALAFLTAVPARTGAPDASASAWFGPVGALVGAAVGAAWWAGTEAWNPLVGAAVAIAVDLALTGLLHLDGVADAADGLLPPLPREQRLAVMAAPDVGGFGVGAVGALLLLRLGALTSLAPQVWLAAAVWAAARAVAAVVLATVPAARAGGLGDRFSGGHLALPMLTIGAAATACAALAPSLAGGLVAVPAVVVGAVAVVGLAVRRLGGHTGDVLGAAIVVGETAGLLALGARW